MANRATDQVLARARTELAAGRRDQAAGLCRQVLAVAAADGAALDLAGVIALGAGHGDLAVALHRRALALAPDDPGIQRNLGLALNRLGRRREAIQVLSRLLAGHPAFPGARDGLAAASLPGDDYLAVLGYLHDALRPATYVEIGVDNGASLALARPPTLAIGVDPAPCLSHPVATETRVFAMTSDAFFTGPDADRALGGRRVDMAFIDGLHTFDQALRDFANLERHAAASAVVVFHDVRPLDEISSARVRRSDFWTGDVWKVLPALRRHRPDLTMMVIPAPPSGLLVVSGLDPASTVLAGVFDRMVEDLMPLTFADWQAGRPDLGAVTVANRRAAVVGRLASRT